MKLTKQKTSFCKEFRKTDPDVDSKTMMTYLGETLRRRFFSLGSSKGRNFRWTRTQLPFDLQTIRCGLDSLDEKNSMTQMLEQGNRNWYDFLLPFLVENHKVVQEILSCTCKLWKFVPILNGGLYNKMFDNALTGMQPLSWQYLYFHASHSL